MSLIIIGGLKNNLGKLETGDTWNFLNGLWESRTIKLLRSAHKFLLILMTQQKCTMSPAHSLKVPSCWFVIYFIISLMIKYNSFFKCTAFLILVRDLGFHNFEIRRDLRDHLAQRSHLINEQTGLERLWDPLAVD